MIALIACLLFYLLLKWISNQDNCNRKKKKKNKLTPKWHHQGGKLEEGETRLTLLEDGDEELKNGEKPEVLPEPGLDPPINTMGGYKKRQQRKKKKTKQKKLFSQHMGLILLIMPLCSWYLTWLWKSQISVSPSFLTTLFSHLAYY